MVSPVSSRFHGQKPKQRKVSAIRDFPEAFQQFTMQIALPPNEGLAFASTVKDLLDIEVSEVDLDDDDDSVEPFDLVPSETHILTSKLESEKVEPIVSFDCAVVEKALDGAEIIEQLEILRHECTDSTYSILSRGKSKLKDGSHTQQVYRPSCLKKKVHKVYRKVSAVRDFPQTMEQFDTKTNGPVNEPLVAVGIFENLAGKADSAGVLQENLVHREMPGLSFALKSEKLEPMFADDLEEALQLGEELPDAMDDAEFINPFETSEHETNDCIGSVRCTSMFRLQKVSEDKDHTQPVDWPGRFKMGSYTSPKKKFPQRRVSAVRCFPPKCGRNSTLHGKEDCVQMLASHKNRGLGHKDSSMEQEPFEGVVQSDAKQATEEAQPEYSKLKEPVPTAVETYISLSLKVMLLMQQKMSFTLQIW
ncbi:unnamed protein product [Ilex paraguariensis]|uniref:Uncharacterized protein n=1 Tax=Ilex paraguariensis TaxID=185542 RepID=A0ABC8TNW0_9AQUA